MRRGLRIRHFTCCVRMISFRKLEKRLFITHVKGTKVTSHARFSNSAPISTRKTTYVDLTADVEPFPSRLVLWTDPLTFINSCAISQSRREPLLDSLVQNRDFRDVTTKTLETLQVLVSFGATWDAKCDELVSSGEAWGEAPALRICLSLWAQELAHGLPFTNIPLEVIQRGADATHAYIREL
jgi:hypothetical protein